MYTMSKACEISNNVWLGPTPDPNLLTEDTSDHPQFNCFIEASDMAMLPDSKTLASVESRLAGPTQEVTQLDFPSSGSIMPPTWSQSEVDSLMETIQWIYRLANPKQADELFKERDDDGDGIMRQEAVKPCKFLIHCMDGYTETTLLALTYFMYAEGVPAHDAWLRLHREKGRNFFAYATDVALLTSIQPRILQSSPRWHRGIADFPAEPQWLSRMDGSLPSRILPYMYLGNLGHANNSELLKQLGISGLLSVGESVSWPKEAYESWGSENLLYIGGVQDNGVDPLTEEFDRCLEFIGRHSFAWTIAMHMTDLRFRITEQGKRKGMATLVHCRVGVSRSATICIAEVMKALGLSFPRA